MSVRAGVCVHGDLLKNQAMKWCVRYDLTYSPVRIQLLGLNISQMRENGWITCATGFVINIGVMKIVLFQGKLC